METHVLGCLATTEALAAATDYEYTFVRAIRLSLIWPNSQQIESTSISWIQKSRLDIRYCPKTLVAKSDTVIIRILVICNVILSTH